MFTIKVIDLDGTTVIDQIETVSAIVAMEWMDELETTINPANVGEVVIASNKIPLSVEVLVALAEREKS